IVKAAWMLAGRKCIRWPVGTDFWQGDWNGSTGCCVRAGFGGSVLAVARGVAPASRPWLSALLRLGGDSGVAGTQRPGLVRRPFRSPSAGFLGIAVQLDRRADRRVVSAAVRRAPGRGKGRCRALRLRENLDPGDR